MNRPDAIQVCALEHIFSVTRIAEPSHVLSLLSPGTIVPWPVGLKPLNHRHLVFHDMARPSTDMPDAILPSADHVAEVLAFAEHWRAHGNGPLIVHCYAGISRSTAAAYMIACALAPHQNEATLAQRLRLATPTATPNALLIAHADILLGRDGRMVDAIDDIGNGRFAAQCTPFRLEYAH